VGFFLSGHPFQEYHEFVDALPVSTARQTGRLGEGSVVDLIGVVTSYVEARDKHKRVYAKTHFEDRTGMVEMIVYARLYEQTAILVGSDAILVATGRIRVRSDGKREMVAERLVHVDEAMAQWTEKILLRLDLDAAPEAAVNALSDLLAGTGPGEGTPGPRAAATPAVAKARPVPLLVEAQRQGHRWLLRSAVSTIPLHLANLRRLRDLPGSMGCRLLCQLPALKSPSRRPNGKWQRRAVT
jgi:hypothetical protein